MKNCPTILLAALFIGLVSPALAQTPPAAPLHLAVTKPLTPVKDVLTSLSQQSGVTILADDTVVDTLGVTSIDKPTLPEMLDTITSLVPAVTWQQIEIPGDTPIPDANVLSAQVRDLKAFATSHLTITDPTAHTTMKYTRATTDTSKFSDTTDRTIYLLTNETVRAQRLASKQTADAKTQAATPLNQTVGGMQNVAASFGQLTPDQQRTALPQMFQQFRQIMQNIDPSVIQDLRQQAQQNGGNPFGGNNGPGAPRGQ